MEKTKEFKAYNKKMNKLAKAVFNPKNV